MNTKPVKLQSGWERIKLALVGAGILALSLPALAVGTVDSDAVAVIENAEAGIARFKTMGIAFAAAIASIIAIFWAVSMFRRKGKM